MLKNKRAEITTGTILILFIGIIVGLALLSGAYAPIGTSTDTRTLTEGLYTSPAAGSCLDLIGQELLSTPTATNRSSGVALPATNYTISEGISTVDGLKRIRFCTVAAGATQGPINVSYSYGAEGYADDAGSRSIIGIIILLAAIAIAIWVLKPVLESRDAFG